MTNITPICSAVITLLVALASLYLIPLIKSKYSQEQIKQALSTAQQVNYWVSVFVQAAEQQFPEPGTGESKKAYVSTLIEQKLKELNIEVDTVTLNAQIESAVYELNSQLIIP